MRTRLPEGWNCEFVLDALVNQSKDFATLVCDPTGNIIYCNLGAEILLGYQKEALHQLKIDAIFTPEDRELGVPQKELEKALREGSASDERWHLRNDGVRIWASGALSAIKTSSGEVVGFSKIFRDQTLRKVTEDRIKIDQSELTHFAEMASHDLQEPLRGVSSFLQMLANRQEGKLDEESQEFIQFCLDSARRMKSLISDLLDYAQSRERRARFEITESNAAFDVAVANLQKAVEEAGALVTRTPLPAVNAIPFQLARVFQNLIGNALKFRREATPKVFVDAIRRDHAWLFSVRDSGIGIAPENIENIFSPFKRLHSKQQYPGSGLGLSACKNIVEAHGGKIWAESELGRGTVFYFSVPDK